MQKYEYVSYEYVVFLHFYMNTHDSYVAFLHFYDANKCIPNKNAFLHILIYMKLTFCIFIFIYFYIFAFLHMHIDFYLSTFFIFIFTWIHFFAFFAYVAFLHIQSILKICKCIWICTFLHMLRFFAYSINIYNQSTFFFCIVKVHVKKLDMHFLHFYMNTHDIWICRGYEYAKM